MSPEPKPTPPPATPETTPETPPPLPSTKGEADAAIKSNKLQGDRTTDAPPPASKPKED